MDARDTVPVRSRRRVLLGVLLGGGVGAILAACGTSGTSGGSTADSPAPPAGLRAGATIVWAVDDGPTRTPLREEQTRLFKERFPGITVEYVTGATSTAKLQALVAAGTPPDLFRQETAGHAFFASHGQSAPLDGYLKRDKYDLSDFFPAAWELWKWRGKYYGVPFLGIRIAYYNRDLLRQVGARAVPATWRDRGWTWDAFLDVCRRATVRQGTSATRWGADLGTSRRDWQPWVWSNGGDLFDAAGTMVRLDEPAAVEALQFLADLVHKHRVAPTAEELKAQGGRRGLFLGSNLLLYHTPVNNIAANRREAGFDWSITGLPRGRAPVAAASGGGVGWFLAQESQVKEETWALLKLLASKESVRLEAERGEAPPSRKSVANEPAFISPAEPPKADMRVVVEALELMHVETPLIEGVEIDRILDEELGPLWQGQKTAREVLTQAAARIRPLLNPRG